MKLTCLCHRPKLIQSISCLLWVYPFTAYLLQWAKWAWSQQRGLGECSNINFLLLLFYPGSLPGPRSIVHCCHPTPQPPLHFQRQEHLCTPMSPNASFSSGCEVWNACHCFHSCAATTHFHACYWRQKGTKLSVFLFLQLVQRNYPKLELKEL